MIEEMYHLVPAMEVDMLTFRFDVAITVGVAHIADEAVAGGKVVAHEAFGVLATAARAGIAALLVHTRQLRGAIKVDYTLRATGLVGITEVFWEALAGANSILLPTLGK